MLSSFKHKLAVYFLLLAVAPLTAAFWGFGTLAKREEERRVDARLEAELRAVYASYGQSADQVRVRARSLGARRDIQRGFRLGRFGSLPRGVAAGPTGSRWEDEERSRRGRSCRSGQAGE